MSGWKPPPQDKCPKCNKSVYANEQKLASGKKWHIMCFKCESCNKLLESTTQAEHEGKLYCKSCHGRQFGTRGYGYGGGAGTLSMDGSGGARPAVTTVQGGAVAGGCPRCGKRVYAAEKIIGCGKDWHKSCFNCKSCHKSLDSTTTNDKDGEIYCKACYGRQFGPKGVGYGLGAGTLSTTGT